MISGTSWFNSVPHDTLLLAGATVVLALVAAWGAIESHRAANAASSAAQAANDQAGATADSVQVARDALEREHRPLLTDVAPRKGSVYGITSDRLRVVPGTSTGSATFCTVPLQNVGTGTAVIEHEDPCPAAQVRHNLPWYAGKVDALLLPGGEPVLFEVEMPIVPSDDADQSATIYVRVAYGDLMGHRFTTYLCLMRDEVSDSIEHADRWSVHGVAIDDGDRFVQSGEGWQGLDR